MCNVSISLHSNIVSGLYLLEDMRSISSGRFMYLITVFTLFVRMSCFSFIVIRSPIDKRRIRSTKIIFVVIMRILEMKEAPNENKGGYY